MSTRSYICKENEDGTYTGIYCHWDGYLDHNGRMLLEHYNTIEKVNSLLKLGNISFLDCELEPNPKLPHNFENKQDGVTFAYGRDKGEAEQEAHTVSLEDLNQDLFIEYIYVFIQDKKWKYFIGGELHKGMKSVKEDLDKLDSIPIPYLTNTSKLLF